ncbi:hypothetical protein M413DRAFT_32741 [Hebeloma cylindrosporum]|uniref:Uncharacterized protein n=1 Tax=Hebeloma cylindrosporum TaxID=76867 RepID=A0A0C2Y218_HEBCY|nr:hypothetical protein M413DRAFT_32741 [Hebeloma cylindrosporum h7]
MSLIENIVEVFLRDIAALRPGNDNYREVDAILAPALEAEMLLRRFFGTNHPLVPTNPHAGLIDVFSILPIPTTIGRDRVTDLDSAHLFPFLDADNHRFRLPDGSPAFVTSDRFMRNWDIFTDRILKDLDWSNVVAAGGAVLGCLKPTVPGDKADMAIMKDFQSGAYNSSDLDLFIYGLSQQQAKEKMQSIENQVRARALFPIVCVRKAHTVTIYTAFPARPIQIILRLYRSPAEVLTGFDVDASCCAFDGTRVWLSPRSLVSFMRQSITIDMTRRSPSYEVRLSKYARRGFEVYFPELRRGDINLESAVLDRNRDTFLSGVARLLILEELSISHEAYPNLTYPPGRRITMRTKDTVPEPLEEDIGLAYGNYDFSWRQLPYGVGCDAFKIQKLSIKMDNKVNNPTRRENENRRLHRHVVFAGKSCPVPETEDERAMLRRESESHIYGRLTFMEMNPGRQLIGSFNPITTGDWTAEAYQ